MLIIAKDFEVHKVKVENSDTYSLLVLRSKFTLLTKRKCKITDNLVVILGERNFKEDIQGNKDY